MNRKILLNNIRTYKKDSLRDMAKRVELSPTYLSMVELYKKDLTPSLLNKILVAYPEMSKELINELKVETVKDYIKGICKRCREIKSTDSRRAK